MGRLLYLLMLFMCFNGCFTAIQCPTFQNHLQCLSTFSNCSVHYNCSASRMCCFDGCRYTCVKGLYKHSVVENLLFSDLNKKTETEIKKSLLDKVTSIRGFNNVVSMLSKVTSVRGFNNVVSMLSKIPIRRKDAIRAINVLNKILQNANITNPINLYIVVDTIRKSLNVIDPMNEEVTRTLLNIVDILLDVAFDLIKQSELLFQTATIFLEQLDMLSEKQNLTNNKTLNMHNKNIGMSMMHNPMKDLTIYILKKSNKMYINQNGKQSFKNYSVNFHLPLSLIQKISPTARICSYVFENNKWFISRKTQSSVESKVFSLSIEKETVSNLKEPVTFSFAHTHEGIKYTSCRYWQPYKDKNNNNGYWSTKGCYKVRKTSNGYTQCSCNHLTNFALLLDVEQKSENTSELEIVTWVGCWLSIGGLVLTLTINIGFSSIQKKLPLKILICLSFSLLSLLVIFLFGVDKTSSPNTCHVISGLIQYFLLSTFCWMAVECVSLYQITVNVFGRRNEKFLIYASIFGWGLPLIIVVTTGIVNRDHFTKNSQPHLCLVDGYSFYFGTMLPCCFILLLNFVLFIPIFNAISGKNRVTTGTKRMKFVKRARITFGCSLLLGFTWMFAVLAVSDFRLIFQWLFCIFNSLQGFFIFIFYTARSPDVQKVFKKKLFSHKADSFSPSKGNTKVTRAS